MLNGSPDFHSSVDLTEPVGGLETPARPDGAAYTQVRLLPHRCIPTRPASTAPGRTIAYEPSAIVSHVHRADLAQMSKQMVAYGSGCTAALTAIVLRHPQARLELAARPVSGVLGLLEGFLAKTRLDLTPLR